MHSAELAILYEPERGRPLTVARVGDRRIPLAAAEAAIAEAEERADARGAAAGVATRAAPHHHHPLGAGLSGGPS
jgi:hypothetical protein